MAKSEAEYMAKDNERLGYERWSVVKFGEASGDMMVEAAWLKLEARF